MPDCGPLDFGCKMKDFASSAVGDALTNAANATLEAVSKAVSSLGTLWVNVGTPNLTGGAGESSREAGLSASGSEGIETVLGYVTWISFGIAVMSLIALGVRLGRIRRMADTTDDVGQLGLVLGATVIISSAAGIIAALVPEATSGGSPAVAYVQNSLWWYMAAAAIFSVIIAGTKMAWEQRAQPGKDLLQSLITLVVVNGASVTVINLLVVASDSFAVWIINGSLDCDVTNSNGTCFGGNMITLLGLTVNPVTGGLGAILIMVIGLATVLVSIVQILLMLTRSAMLVVLTGILPTAAAMERGWLKKATSWLVAFILYKPAAAIIYATAFKLAGTNVFKDNGTGLVSVLTGLSLMVMSVVALPALMRFVTPMVSALSGGGSAATVALAGAAMMPTGAAQIGRLMGGGSGGGPSSDAPSGSGPGGSGSDGTPGGSGTGTSGSQGTPGGSGTGTSGSQGTPGGSGTGTAAGPAGAGAGGGVAASGGGAGAAAGAAAAGPVGAAASGAGGALSASGGGAGAAAGAAAAGPVGAAASAAGAALSAAGTAAAAAESIVENSAGEVGGPDGSR